jgi:hypothetical protein
MQGPPSFAGALRAGLSPLLGALEDLVQSLDRCDSFVVQIPSG